MFAFVFHTSQSRAYIKPFEAILARLAFKHHLAYATTFDTNLTPHRYAFIVRLAKHAHLQRTITTTTHNAATRDSTKLDPTLLESKTAESSSPQQSQPAPHAMPDSSADSPHAHNPHTTFLHECVLKFADSISKELPVSMLFIFHSIEPLSHCDKHFRTTHTRIPPHRSHFIPTITELNTLLSAFKSQAPHFATLSKQFFSTLYASPLNHTPDKRTHLTKRTLTPLAPKQLFSYIHALFTRLQNKSASPKHQQSITIQTPKATYALSLTPPNPTNKSSTQPKTIALFWDTQTLQTFMRVDSTQISLLASLEKPATKLCVKEVFREQFLPQGGVEIPCMLAFDPMFMLLGVIARTLEIEYIFLTHQTTRQSRKQTPDLSYHNVSFNPSPRLIVCGRDGIFIEDKKTTNALPVIITKHYPTPTQSTQDSSPQNTRAESNSQQRIINASQMLVCYLSSSHNSAFWTYDGKKFYELLPIHFFASEAHILHTLATHYDGADRLLHNYAAHFGSESLDFHTHKQTLNTYHAKSHNNPSPNANAHASPNLAPIDSTPIESSNLLDMFAIIARVLGLCAKDTPTQKATQALLDSAKLCLRDKGPRIDFKLVKENDRLKLDYPRILRSCMSFALAGVEREMISYGVVDSCAEFLGGFVRDITQNYAIKQVFFCGDILTHKIFFDKILLYLPRDITLILPQDGWVDSRRH